MEPSCVPSRKSSFKMAEKCQTSCLSCRLQSWLFSFLVTFETLHVTHDQLCFLKFTFIKYNFIIDLTGLWFLPPWPWMKSLRSEWTCQLEHTTVKQCGSSVKFAGHVDFIKDYGPTSMSPGAETSMSNAVGNLKADRTGYHLKALQEIRNSLKPFATENSSPLPTLQKDGHISYQQHHYPYSSSGYIEVTYRFPLFTSLLS